MLRTTIARTAAAALAGSLLVVATPASSEASPESRTWGTIASKDHVLKRGCHLYAYRYEITAPTDDWSAEVFVVRPDGLGLAGDAIDTSIDPDRGRRKVEICSPSTSIGRHTIKMKITYNPRDRVVRDGFVKPDRFRFTRR